MPGFLFVRTRFILCISKQMCWFVTMLSTIITIAILVVAIKIVVSIIETLLGWAYDLFIIIVTVLFAMLISLFSRGKGNKRKA